MSILNGKKQKFALEIDTMFDRLMVLPKNSKEYTETVDNLERLYKAKSLDSGNQISKDTIVIVAGNLLGIGLILSFEQLNVITSKAMGMVLKGRV